MKEKIITLVILIFIMFLIYSCNATASAYTYNNGIHEGCGGHWVYESAVGHYYTTNFIYHCDKCGMTVELSEKY